MTAEPGSAETRLLALAPERRRVSAVRVEGVEARAVGESGLLWEVPAAALADPDARTIAVLAEGEAEPRLRARVLAVEPEEVDDAAARRAAEEHVSCWTIDLLRVRSQWLESLPYAAERAFLVAFDFLTHPELTRFWSSLAPEELEAALRAETGWPRRVLRFLSCSLELVEPLERVRALVGEHLHRRLLLVAGDANAILGSLGEEAEVRDDVACVARWLEGLFDEFGPSARPLGVRRALLHFADGRLWCGTEVPIPTMLNGSPDSPLFYGLAEFALAAAHHAEARAFWGELARLAVRLQPVYLRRFAPLPEHRSADEYSEVPRARHAFVDWDPFVEALERPATEADLLREHSRSYLQALWNDVDADDDHPFRPFASA